MIKIVIAMVRAKSVNAIGHATRYGFADFDIGRSAFCSDAIEQEQITSKKKAANLRPQKITAPHTR
jgi:hypothetical protein